MQAGEGTEEQEEQEEEEEQEEHEGEGKEEEDTDVLLWPLSSATSERPPTENRKYSLEGWSEDCLIWRTWLTWLTKWKKKLPRGKRCLERVYLLIALAILLAMLVLPTPGGPDRQMILPWGKGSSFRF